MADHSPIYVYDDRKTFERPVFVVYNEDHIEPVMMALFGENPEWAFVTRQKMHNVGAPPYSNGTSTGGFRCDKKKFAVAFDAMKKSQTTIPGSQG